METNNRRDFLKKAALAGASALVAPSLFAADGEGRGELSPKIKAGDLESKLIVPNTIAKSKNSRPKNKMCH